ncbi:MAG: MFS transporter [Chloroflexi bacterium]|nr:MFS transporter [Chloroflexota bacterium]
MKKQKIFFGWWIVAFSFICISVYSGIGYYAHSLFIEPLENEFEWSRSQISVGFTVMYVAIAVSSPFIGRIIDRYNTKKIMVTGAFIVGVGFILLSRTQTLWNFYCSYVLVGLGSACCGFIPFSALIANWFSRRRGTALGITMTGIGIGGTVIASFIGTYLIPHFGWRNAYFSMAFLPWVIVIPIVIFLLKSKPSELDLYPDGVSYQKDLHLPQSTISISDGWTRGKAIRTLSFWLILISFSTGTFANTAVVQHQVPHLRDIGFNMTIAASALGAVGIGSTAGKFIFGWLSDIIPVKYSQLLCFIFGTVAIIIFMNINSQTGIYVIWVYALFIGLAMGGWASNTPMMVSTIFGLKSYGAIYGIINLPIMLATAFGPYVAGAIYDATNSYQILFLISLGLSAIAILTMLMLPQPKMINDPENK